MSITRERIRQDLDKIFLYEEELANLYDLMDRVAEYFELLSFDTEVPIEETEENEYEFLKRNSAIRKALEVSPLYTSGKLGNREGNSLKNSVRFILISNLL
jgi:hypothetical protein